MILILICFLVCLRHGPNQNVVFGVQVFFVLLWYHVSPSFIKSFLATKASLFSYLFWNWEMRLRHILRVNNRMHLSFGAKCAEEAGGMAHVIKVIFVHLRYLTESTILVSFDDGLYDRSQSHAKFGLQILLLVHQVDCFEAFHNFLKENWVQLLYNPMFVKTKLKLYLPPLTISEIVLPMISMTFNMNWL